MPVVHIRIIELKCSETRNRVNYFFVNFYTNNKPYEVQKLSIDIAQKNSQVLSSCSKSISLDVDNQLQSQLCIQLKRHRMLISDDDVGKVVIPLKWFPRRKVVREWFPLTSAGKLKKTLMDNIHDLQGNPQTRDVQPEINDGSEKLMLLLDIHIAKNKEKAFDAPFSSMRVLPSWKKPLLLQNSEFPPIPPISYIAGQNPDRTTDDTIPLHQSYVVMMQPEQMNQINNNVSPTSLNVNVNNNNHVILNNSNNNSSQQHNQQSNLQQQPLNLQQNQQSNLQQQPLNLQQENQPQSELHPYFPAPQPNSHPTNNLVLPPFMQGSEEGHNVTLITEFMSPYSHPNSMSQTFATDDVPNVYYPQVSIINEEEDDDDDDDDDDIKDDDNKIIINSDSENNNNNDDDDDDVDLKDDIE